jgi:mono/diheme cytochrome c family protein
MVRFLRDAIVTVVVLAAVIWFVAFSHVRAGGLSADVQPGSMERAVATRLVRLSIPAGADREENPFSSAPDAWRTAAAHFEDHCAVCHGADGHGRTAMGENMYPKVPDLADPGVQRLSDGALFYIIQNGVRWTGMPGWKHEHSPEEAWRLVSFTRKVPSLTADELESVDVTDEHRGHAHEHGREGGHDHEQREDKPRGSRM